MPSRCRGSHGSRRSPPAREGCRHDQLQPHEPNEADEQMPGRERYGCRDRADKNGTGNAGARAIRPRTRGHSDKPRHAKTASVNSSRPIATRDASIATTIIVVVSVRTKSDVALSTTTARLKYSVRARAPGAEIADDFRSRRPCRPFRGRRDRFHGRWRRCRRHIRWRG